MKTTFKNICFSICVSIAIFISIFSFKNLAASNLAKLYNTNVFGMMIIFALVIKTLSKENIKLSKSKNIISIILSLFMILGECAQSSGNIGLIWSNIATFVITIFKFIGFFTIFKICLHYLDLFLKSLKFKEMKPKNKHFTKFLNYFDTHPFKASFIVIFLFFSIFMIAFYPIVLSPDPSNQILQYYNVRTKYVDWAIQRNPNVFMTNHHPIMQTYLIGWCIDLGRFLINDNFGLFIYTFIQTIIYVSVLAYTIKFFKDVGGSLKLRFILLLIYLIVPHYAFYSVSAVKDTLYTAFMALLILFMVDIVRNYKDKKISIKYITFIAIDIILLSLMRHNGLYIAILSFIGLMFYSKINLKKLVISLFSFSLVVISFNKVLVPYLGIADASIREVLSVPFQQTARLAKYHDEGITKKDKEVIDKILNYDTLKDRYDPRLADDVKNEFNKYATKDEIRAYFKVWFKYLLKYPVTYINATLDNMYGYIYPNQHYWYVYDTYDKRVVKNNVVDYHFNKKTKFLRDSLIFYESVFPYLPGIGLISSIGFSTWIVLILSVYIKKKKNLIPYIPIYASILICFISPANTYFRYALPYIFILPFMVLLFISDLKGEKNEKR